VTELASGDKHGAMSEVPEGFTQLVRTSPFNTLIGPVYTKGLGAELTLGMWAQAKHANMRGIVHGGVIATLVDIALGYSTAFSSDPPGSYVTAHLSIDYAGSAKVGDWLEARVDIQRRGARLAFANCFVWVEDTRIVHASAVFAAVELPRVRSVDG
jgi:acyl-coenzyme A thioesterase 13